MIDSKSKSKSKRPLANARRIMESTLLLREVP